MKRNLVTKLATLSMAAVVATSMVACGGPKPPKATDATTAPNESATASQAPDAPAAEVAKPTKITAMMTTIMTKENGLDDVCAEYKNKTGIELQITKPDHTQFYEKVNLSFASGDVANVIELGSTYYPNYATYGALWDMTDAWEKSTEPVKSIVDESYVDAIRIGGKLYGFPMQKGNGTVTYVRQDWMDELGLKAPTDYNEFLDMLRAFKTKGANIIPITAAGLYNSENPYDMYLREFYQDARPDFVLKDGKYVDGMLEPEMVAALERMRQAYSEGLIDKEIVTNKTSTCRDKLFANLAGCFNYWAGYWNKTLEENLVAAVPTAKLTPLPGIKEAKYIERVPTAMVITSASQDPEGIFKYFIEYSHDGGEGQMLFTHGVEGEHWKVDENGKTVALPFKETPDKLVEKTLYSPELSITNFDDPIVLDERVANSLEVFKANSQMDAIPKTSDVIAATLPEINTIKSETINKIVFGEYTVEEGLKQYQAKAGEFIDTMLNELNSQL